MSIVEILLIAVGLSMDAFAVSVGKGLGMRRIDLRQAGALAVSFGVFQGVMPVIGWLVGSQFALFITEVDHWIAFGLLAAIGGKMLVDAVRGEDDEAESPGTALGLKELLILAIATSIDALAAGIGFAFLNVDIVQVVALIGLTTAALSFLGVLVGHKLGSVFKRPASIAGGVILIAIGSKILLEHLGVLG